MTNLQAEMKNYNIEDFDLYMIKLKFYRAHNPYIPFNLIEIVSAKKIVSNMSLQSHLLFLKNQFQSLLGITIDIRNDLKLINQNIENHRNYCKDSNI